MGMAAFRSMHRVLADLCGGADEIELLPGLNARETAIEFSKAVNQGLSVDQARTLWDEHGHIPSVVELARLDAEREAAQAAEPETIFQGSEAPGAGAVEPQNLEAGEDPAFGTGPDPVFPEATPEATPAEFDDSAVSPVGAETVLEDPEPEALVDAPAPRRRGRPPKATPAA